MDKRPICLLAALLMCATGALASEAFRWVDSEGVVHYSDRPREGAERVELEPSPAPRTRQPARRSATASPADGTSPADSQQAVQYESLEIVSPGAEETLWNIEGVLNVSLALTPALQQGDQVRVYFDGKPQQVTGTSFQIDEVYRGVHNLQAEVLDETGKLLIRSQPNRFYVQQNTVAF